MEENLLTINEVKEYFNVKDNRTILKFIKQGLPFIPIRNKRKEIWPKRCIKICRKSKTIRRNWEYSLYKEKSKKQKSRYRLSKKEDKPRNE